MTTSRLQLKKRSVIPSPVIQYKSTLNYYKSFLGSFQERMKTIIQKQSYRIYLQDKVNQKKIKQLIKQQEQLLIDIQKSKNYTLSMNRGLIQEIINLQKLKQEYGQVFINYSQKINQNSTKINTMKQQVKQLQKNIKSCWIYDYDLIDSKAIQKINKLDYRNGNTLMNQSTLTPSLFPSLKMKKINCIKFQNKSFVNQSKNKQKIMAKISTFNSELIKQNFDYEKEKLTLLQLFSYHLKDILEQQNDKQQKYKIVTIMEEIHDQIDRKQKILLQMRKIIY